MEKEKILEVKDLKVSFQTFQGSVQAVRGVSWHLNKKETIAIVGESGCGQTVTIQTVIGLNHGAIHAALQGFQRRSKKKGSRDLKDDFTSVTRGKYEALSASAFRRYAPAYHDCNGTHL